MKNLHLIPTDKPSRLSILNSGKLNFGAEAMSSSNSKLQHIYITSDEQAKEGDWGYIPFEGGNVKLVGKYFADDWKKIILTTDQDLIKDGVQAIDDEFLEWFVQNPSCESVEVEDYPILKSIFDGPNDVEIGWQKKIIIPKQEPKQETIEEAAKRTYQKGLQDDIDLSFYDGVRLGSKWQAERMYSEEDIREAYFSAIKITGEGWNGEYAGGNSPNIEDKFSEEFKEWFEQFKKNGGDK